MRRFAELFEALDGTRATGRKLALMQAYFAAADDADVAWGLYFLTGRRLKRVIAPGRLRAIAAGAAGIPDWMLERSHAHVGDLAETIALLLDDGNAVPSERPLAQWVGALKALRDADEARVAERLTQWWRALPRLECFLLNKLLTGSLRVGVSAGLATRALAAAIEQDENLVAQRLMGDWQPDAGLLAQLRAPPEAGTIASQPYPFCLAAPLEGEPATLGALADHLVEWKWDGIRAQLIRREGRVFLWSRGEELLDGRFPEVGAAAMALPDGHVLDGELLVWTDGVRPFGALQRRINKQKPGLKLLREAPVVFLAYDLLEADGADGRAMPARDRRARLEALIAGHGGDATPLRLSPLVAATDWQRLAALRAEARSRGVEGFVLKRADAPYTRGRRRGVWWKWKVDPLTVDAVLVYAQAGHGRRSNLYTDYTLAVWDGAALVPVAKAYSGLTDAELTEMDRWIRRHTVERFGPVRSVRPEQVFEIAFEGIQPSSRHKAGLAVRFPRIHRWRRDKPAAEAGTLDELRGLLEAVRSAS
ncbi:ATP-dependent DNA ligase [Algiphilus sp.]|uniref:ATP-dependent DNA ligase n=1 Tax=Algiphilus sp. TaxID=1872431 RepID=UPI0025C25554|nr:ATP-dependent DNA ligase [Algiphilus sp.]MCK5771465.1 ATP-dependent DNA ligase [Algiphilus sp.]